MPEGMLLGRSGNSRSRRLLPTAILDARSVHDELPKELPENYPDRISRRHLLPNDEWLVVAYQPDMVSSDG
jgi:hypothetical protein